MTENLDLISVIVPIYNAETTLKKCIESILDQCGVAIELILVDDGSTDQSRKICDGFAARYSNIKVYSQKNAGPSSARNKGLQLATGSFISFVDSDDYLEEQMYAQMMGVMRSDKTDLCCCGITKLINNHIVKLPIARCARKVSPLEYLHDMVLTSLGGYAYNRVYKREIIGAVKFDKDRNFAEDLIFNCSIWEHLGSVSYISSCPYVYTFREGSLSNKSENFIIDGEWAFSGIGSELKKVLPKKNEDIDEVLSCREAKQALDGIRIFAGKPQYRKMRNELLHIGKRNLKSYFKLEPQLYKKVLALITLYAPEWVLALLMNLWNRSSCV